jgi:hypothetical protein
VNILKVFEDFRQLSIGDQAKIVEWYNSQRGGEPSRNWSNASAQKVSALKQEKHEPRTLYTEAQVDFIDYGLHEGDRNCVIADKCLARWPGQHGKEAWLTKISERKSFLRKRGEL